jgi:hypothetical protein
MVEVECQDCGHSWDSSAKKPRCKCDSYDVVEIGEESPEESGESTEEISNDSPESSNETEPSGDSGSEESGGLSLGLFETEENDTGDVADDPPELGGGEESSEESGESTEGDDDPDAEIPELDPEDIRPFFELAFGEQDPEEYDQPQDGILSRRQGEHYRMKEYELDRLSKSWSRVANKYAPYLMAEYTVEGMAVMTTAMIMMPRIREDQRRKERAERAATDDSSGAAEERGGSARSNGQGPAQRSVTDEIAGETPEPQGDVATAYSDL